MCMGLYNLASIIFESVYLNSILHCLGRYLLWKRRYQNNSLGGLDYCVGDHANIYQRII